MTQQGQYSTWEFPILKFLKGIGLTLLIGFILGVIAAVIAYETDWYWRALRQVGQVFIDQWWLGPALATVLAIVIYVNRPRKQKEETKQDEQKK